MKVYYIIIAFLILSVSVYASDVVSFGEKIKSDKVIKVSKLKPTKDKVIVAEGTITAVCQSAGCWVMLNEGEKSVFVKARNEGFAMPKNSIGSVAKAMGTVKEQDFSDETLKHYEEEGLVLTAEVKKTKKMLYMDAMGVEIQPAKGTSLESTEKYFCPHPKEGEESDSHEKKSH